MSGLWAWVIGLVSLGGTVITIVLGIRTFAAADVPTFTFGLVVGLTLGAVGCAVVWFRKPSSAAHAPIPPGAPQENIGDGYPTADRVVPETAAGDSFSTEADEQALPVTHFYEGASRALEVAAPASSVVGLAELPGQGQPSARSPRRLALIAAAVIGVLGFVAFVVGLSVFTTNKPLSYGIGPTGLILICVAAGIAAGAWITQFAYWLAKRHHRARAFRGERPGFDHGIAKSDQ